MGFHPMTKILGTCMSFKYSPIHEPEQLTSNIPVCKMLRSLHFDFSRLNLPHLFYGFPSHDKRDQDKTCTDSASTMLPVTYNIIICDISIHTPITYYRHHLQGINMMRGSYS